MPHVRVLLSLMLQIRDRGDRDGDYGGRRGDREPLFR